MTQSWYDCCRVVMVMIGSDMLLVASSKVLNVTFPSSKVVVSGAETEEESTEVYVLLPVVMAFG